MGGDDSWVWELSNEFIGRSGVPEAEIVEAWRVHVERFCAGESDGEGAAAAGAVVDAGQRLSFCFPNVSRDLQNFLRRQLAAMADATLARIVEGVEGLLDLHNDKDAELVLDLVRFVPRARLRLEALAAADPDPALLPPRALAYALRYLGDWEELLQARIRASGARLELKPAAADPVPPASAAADAHPADPAGSPASAAAGDLRAAIAAATHAPSPTAAMALASTIVGRFKALFGSKPRAPPQTSPKRSPARARSHVADRPISKKRRTSKASVPRPLK